MIVISKNNDSIKVRKVGKYILQKELGRGSVGKVWLSFHSGLGIPVAVKILKPHLIEEDPEFLERFIQEGRLAVSLHHKNIVRIFDAGKAGESYYLVMELLEGNDALHIIQHEGAFPVEKVLEIGCAVTDALIEAHEHGVIHRDIKPDNIMITSEGKIKLADLGLAKKLGDEFGSTMVGTTIGTPNYMSPEQAMNSSEANAVSDIYSLGATLYHMLTGTLPFEGDSIMAVMMKHANEALEHPQSRKEGLPDNLCSVIMKMMDKDPANRYQNCEAVLTALNKIRYAPSDDERPKTIVFKTKSFKKPKKKIEELNAAREQKKKDKEDAQKKKKLLLSCISGIILLAVVLGIIFVGGKTDNKQTASSEDQKEKSEPKTEELAGKPKVENKTVEVTSVEPEKKEPAPSSESINLLEQLEIPPGISNEVKLENGVMNISSPPKNIVVSTSKSYSNYKLVFEYKFNRSSCLGKLVVHKSETKAYNIMFLNRNSEKAFTGGIQERLGVSPDWKFTYLNMPDPVLGKEKDTWHKMEIICKANNIKVSVNGHQVSDLDVGESEGKISIIAFRKAEMNIRKLELTELE